MRLFGRAVPSGKKQGGILRLVREESHRVRPLRRGAHGFRRVRRDSRSREKGREKFGGAVQARNCNWNSNAAILEELAKMVYSSQVYGSDTECYKKLMSEDTQYNFDIYDHESI